jgi:hypothetical protein
MSLPPIVLTLSCEQDIEILVETALLNSGVNYSKREIEKGTYQFYLPSPYWVLSVTLNILQSYINKIKGDIKLPDGRGFNIDDTGIAELRQVLVNSMSRRDENVAPQLFERESTFTEIFLEKYQEQVGEIISAIPGWIESWSKSASRLKITMVIMLMALIGATLGIVTWLTLLNRISGEALIFLSGSIVGYAFAFLQKYLGLIQTS